MAKIQPARPPEASPDMKFTGMAKLIIELAIHEAGAENVVRPGHILIAVGASQDSIAAYVLGRSGASAADLRGAIQP